MSQDCGFVQSLASAKGAEMARAEMQQGWCWWLHPLCGAGLGSLAPGCMVAVTRSGPSDVGHGEGTHIGHPHGGFTAEPVRAQDPQPPPCGPVPHGGLGQVVLLMPTSAFGAWGLPGFWQGRLPQCGGWRGGRPVGWWCCLGRGVEWDMALMPAAFSCFPLSYHGNGHGWDRKGTGTGSRHDMQRAFLKEVMGEL